LLPLTVGSEVLALTARIAEDKNVTFGILEPWLLERLGPLGWCELRGCLLLFLGSTRAVGCFILGQWIVQLHRSEESYEASIYQ
jgi:hypothetical protein